jgi:hypothetical protein
MGKTVERLNGGVRLGEHMAESMFAPLDTASSTFRLLLWGGCHGASVSASRAATNRSDA